MRTSLYAHITEGSSIKYAWDTGRNIVHYAERSFDIDGTILFFGNPHIPYAWETKSPTNYGYVCLFSEDFLKLNERTESLLNSPLSNSEELRYFQLRKNRNIF